MDRPDPAPWTPPDLGLPPHPAARPYQPYDNDQARPYPAYGYATVPERRGWTGEIPAGVPYHRMARTSRHRWWRPLAGTLLVVVLAFLVTLGIGLVGFLIYAFRHDGRLPIPKGDTIFGIPVADLALELCSLAALTPVVFLAAWLTQRRRPGTLSSVAGRLRWGWLARCCVLAALFVAVSFGWSYAVTAMFTSDPLRWPAWAGWHTFLLPAIVIVALVPFQATAEEYLFRGWLLQAVGSWVPTRWTGRIARTLALLPALAISAAVFTLGHGYTGWAMLDIFLFALVTGWLAVRTGGLESGIALHVFNNLSAFLFPAAAGQLADSLRQGGGPWHLLVSDLVPELLYVLGVVLLARRRGIQTRTPAPAQ